MTTQPMTDELFSQAEAVTAQVTREEKAARAALPSNATRDEIDSLEATYSIKRNMELLELGITFDVWIVELMNRIVAERDKVAA